jgi:hypothetical protein
LGSRTSPGFTRRMGCWGDWEYTGNTSYKSPMRNQDIYILGVGNTLCRWAWEDLPIGIYWNEQIFFFGSSPFLDKPTPHWEENYTWLYDYTVGIYWNLLIALKHDHSKWSLGSPSGPGQKC